MRATSAAVGGRTSTRCNVASRGTPCLISGRFMPRRNGARPRRWIDASVLDNMAPVADDGVMTPSWHLHAHLIGQPGSRDQLNTPALIVDLEALDANIAAMAAWAREAGVALRPHAKTHKSAEIGKRQIAAGAVGLCCAKLGAADALAAEGIATILLTSPVVTPQAIARLDALHHNNPNLALVADQPAAVAALAAANNGRPIRVMVDVDPGIHRTGVASAAGAVALARQIAAAPSPIAPPILRP